MELKENTIKSSDHLRAIATFIMGMGIFSAALILILGVFLIWSGGKKPEGLTFANLGGIALGFFFIFLAALILLIHYVSYVMISSYATLIENSDRTDVVNALYDINDTLQSLNGKPRQASRVRVEPVEVPLEMD